MSSKRELSIKTICNLKKKRTDKCLYNWFYYSGVLNSSSKSFSHFLKNIIPKVLKSLHVSQNFHVKQRSNKRNFRGQYRVTIETHDSNLIIPRRRRRTRLDFQNVHFSVKKLRTSTIARFNKAGVGPILSF